MKNKKHKKRSQENEAVEDTTDQKPIKAKKKKKKHLKEAEMLAETPEVRETTDEHDQPVKEKKRKKKNKDKQVEVSDADEPREHVEAPKKKKKKNKKLQEEERVIDNSPPPKKKKKTRCEDEHTPNSVDQENVECTGEVAEVSTKKKRKKAKEDKRGAVAEGNGDKEPEIKTQQAVPDLGQWSTADLGDSSRQNKFYQLLGGFKSSSADTKSTKPFAAKFNAALDKKRETQLNNQLERQFEEARLAQFSAKGLGLGFTQPKKNHIDINASQSKKFDD